jgi:hypothetical protein
MKKWFSVAILALCSLGVLSAKSYDIVLTGPASVGTLQLKPGAYHLKVDGSNAVFTDHKSKTYTTPVKVQNADKKFNDTRVQSSKDGATDRINEIDLGGSTTVLGF